MKHYLQTRIDAEDWEDYCYDNDYVNCVLPREKLLELLTMNIDFLYEQIHSNLAGLPTAETIADVKEICQEQCEILVNGYLKSSIPYREKCRIIQYLDCLTDRMARNPTAGAIASYLVCLNAYLDNGHYSDAYHREMNLPLNYREHFLRRSTHGV